MRDVEPGNLSEYEAKQVLADAGVPVVEEELAADADEAVEYADSIGYPVMMKVDSRDIQHKTDIGAVQHAHDADEVRKRHQKIMDNVADNAPDADVNGVLIEEHVDGHELIVGVNQDPDFGHVLMFGLGGIFVEVLHDVHFRAIPVSEYDARQLIDAMETKELLNGVRGEEAVDRQVIVDVITAVSDLVDDNPEIQSLDINPLFVNGDGAVAADALMEVSEK